MDKLDKLERFALKVGRLRSLLKGRGDAPVGDATAWMDSRYWGEGLLKGRKPTGKMDAIEQFTSWVYICARLNATSCSAVTLGLYARVPEGGKSWRSIKTAAVDRRTRLRLAPYWRTKAADVEEVTEHRFLDIMTNVNPFMNSSDLMELTVMFLDLTGEAYWYIIKDRLGVPAELWPVPSQYITAIPGRTFREFITGYRYERGNVKFDVSIEDIIVFSYPNPANQYRGMGVVRGICDAVYTNSKMYEYEESLFEKKARVGGVLESDSGINKVEVDRLREEWKQRYAGTEKAGETVIMPPGLKFVKDSMTNQEISFIEGRKMTWREIAAGFNQPVSLWDEAGNRATVDGAQYFHAKYGVQPRLRKIEEKVNEKLLPMFDDSGILFCAFEDVVPEDQITQLAERTQYVTAGIMTRNEARADMGLDAVEGGDVVYVPWNQAPLGEPEPTTMPEEEPDEDADEFAGKVVERIKEKLGVTGKAD